MIRLRSLILGGVTAALCVAGAALPASAQDAPPAESKPAEPVPSQETPAAPDTGIPSDPAAAGPDTTEDASLWRTRTPAAYETWRPIKREEWDLRLQNALINLRWRCTEGPWSPEEVQEVVDSLERAIRWGVSPDLALSFAQRCVQWRFTAHDSKRILWSLTQAVRSDGKCANISDLMDETFQSNYRGDDLVNALFFEIRKRRNFEEGLIPQEERRKRERREAEARAVKEAERKAAEERAKGEEGSKPDPRKR